MDIFIPVSLSLFFLSLTKFNHWKQQVRKQKVISYSYSQARESMIFFFFLHEK